MIVARSALLVAAFALMAIGCGGSDGSVADGDGAPATTATAPTLEVLPGGDADVASSAAGPFDELAPGACWNDGFDDDGAAMVVEVVSCDGPHAHETVAVAEVESSPDTDYPGVESLEARVGGCIDAADAFAGRPISSTPLRVWVWVPGEAAWNGGDRTVACTVGAHDGSSSKIGTAAGAPVGVVERLVVRTSVDERLDLQVLEPDGSLVALTSGQLELRSAAVQVLDERIVFAARRSGAFDDEPFRAYAFDLATDALTVIDLGTDDTWSIADPQRAVAEPGTVFAARRSDAGDWNLFRSLDDGGVRQLTDAPGDERWPRLLPDEQGIVYNADGALWIMEVDGENQRPITDGLGRDHEAAVSPDGTQIAFTSSRSGNDDVWIVALDGSGLRNVTEHPADDGWPFWSADGRSLYFHTDRLGASSHLMVVDVDGATPGWVSPILAANGAVLPAP